MFPSQPVEAKRRCTAMIESFRQRACVCDVSKGNTAIAAPFHSLQTRRAVMSDTPHPPQHQQSQPGHENQMEPRPQSAMARYRPAGKLSGKAALISGGDSGIGRAVAVAFAKEGADVVIAYLDEHDDAKETVRLIEAEGRRAIAVPGDIGNSDFCREVARRAVQEFGRIDVLVNNAAEQHMQEKLEDISDEQLERTFRTNIFGQFFLSRAVLPHMPDGGAIVNTTSVTAYKGSPTLLDYASTKGAIVAFTRSLAIQLMQRRIRVNAVAPGPIWTPLIPATFPA
ncbi:MAG TPA: SDR family NAD(P)-dependent oxidoreductase, partial [Acetobacteraceae bacterium]|nr:SDR family NAD(P)-dependent oxidoreductase [Acetobacteraceae bacterium]